MLNYQSLDPLSVHFVGCETHSVCRRLSFKCPSVSSLQVSTIFFFSDEICIDIWVNMSCFCSQVRLRGIGHIQWIGLRENLQESPIFHGKIYGFL